jgi:hypothetical protein
MSNDEIQKENKPKIKMSICVNFLNSWPESLDWKYHTWKKTTNTIPNKSKLKNTTKLFKKKNLIMKFEKKINYKKKDVDPCQLFKLVTWIIRQKTSYKKPQNAIPNKSKVQGWNWKKYIQKDKKNSN